MAVRLIIIMRTKQAISIVNSIWVILAMLFSPRIARSCTIVYPTFQVGTTFRVKVTDHGGPVNGLRLVLSLPKPSDAYTASSVYSFTDTDKNGYANFSNLPPGSFLLSVDHDAGVGDTVFVEVSANGLANQIVPLTWPSRTPLSVRSLNGTIRGPDYYPAYAQVLLSLSLLEGVSGRVISNTLTDSKGGFRFNRELEPGIYFLRLNPGELRGWSHEQIEGLIPIELSREAKWDAIDIDLSWSSCGLGYGQREPYPEIKLRKICGDVTDTEGAAISNAEVVLLASGAEVQILEQTKTSITGRFDLREQQEGVYELIIKSSGFQPSVRSVRIESGRRGEGCQQPVHIWLKIM